jgi:carbonic anhydrase/acetyltransferase-like protein (isoleucine patch superfamily)
MAESRPSRPISKRVSTVPAAPKPPATIDPSVILANHATLVGVFPITIGASTILHPYAKVVSVVGAVEIGEGAVIWERAVVGINVEGGARDEDDDAGLGDKFVMLERNCILESGAQVAAKLVGEGTVIEAFATIGEGCVIGKVVSPSLVLIISMSNVYFLLVLQDSFTCYHTAKYGHRRLHNRLRPKRAPQGHDCPPESNDFGAPQSCPSETAQDTSNACPK